MKLKISDDSIERDISFNTISNGQTTERDPNKIVYPEAWHDPDADPDKLNNLDMYKKSIEKLLELEQFKIAAERRENRDWIQDIGYIDTRRIPSPRVDINEIMPDWPSPTSTHDDQWFVLPIIFFLVYVVFLLGRFCFRACGTRTRRVRRQESDEWSTPNVLVTSHIPEQLQHRDVDFGSIPRLEDIEGLAPGAEPPPPYSACYVAYTCPKNADPQVHIRQQNVLDERQHTSTDIDNAHNDLIAHENALRAESVTAANHSEDAAERMELVFDNGRIVERPSLDSNETGVASNDNMVASTRRADVIDKVVYIDETASVSTTPETALRV